MHEYAQQHRRVQPLLMSSKVPCCRKMLICTSLPGDGSDKQRSPDEQQSALILRLTGVTFSCLAISGTKHLLSPIHHPSFLQLQPEDPDSSLTLRHVAPATCHTQHPRLEVFIPVREADQLDLIPCGGQGAQMSTQTQRFQDHIWFTCTNSTLPVALFHIFPFPKQCSHAWVVIN